jgi:nucleoside 2-deoxyribosyltransferase
VKRRIYFAGPLFTQAERSWNSVITRHLRAAGHNVDLPQEQAQQIVKSKDGLTPEERAALFEASVSSIKRCDVVVAIVDGPDADSGTCFEMGFAAATRKPIVAVRTDLRFGGDDPSSGLNLMLSQAAKVLWLKLEGLKATEEEVASLILKELD